MSDVMSKDYVLELLKAATGSNKIMDLVVKHLKFELLQTEAQKKIFKHMLTTHAVTGSAPTIGMIGQAYKDNKEIMATLAKMAKIEVKGKEPQLITSFESFIKDIRIQASLAEVAKLYNEGKTEEAVKYLAAESKAIADFNIRERYYVKIFGGFNDYMQDKEIASMNDSWALLRDKIVTGIHEMDQILNGGYKRGTSFLAMARSGAGKTMYLRWCAIANARLGKKVVVFQAEMTEDETIKGFNKAWTALTEDNIEEGFIPDDMKKEIEKVRKEIIARGGEIIVIAAERFGDKMTIEECYEDLQNIIKREGHIDLVLFDYLELFSAKGMYGKGESAERRRREDIAEKMTDIAVTMNCVVGSATQAAEGNLGDRLDKPEFVLTRFHASEFKGIVKPFSYFFTLNCTNEEYQQEIIRVHLDKLRYNKGSGRTIKMYQARDIGRFYDAVKTKRTFYKDTVNES